MATINANGRTSYGNQKIKIIGNQQIEKIECENEAFSFFVEMSIANACGKIANGYYPPANTMLQALSVLYNIFQQKDVSVDGDIETLPSEKGMIY